jgi:beta-phosphoglucomutase
VPLRAVIFDVDGVLVQSMERHHEAYRRAFQELRIEIKKEEVFANEGRRSREVIESLARAKGLRLSEELAAMNKKKQDAFFAFGPLPLYPGVPELLAKVRNAGLKLAAVTGTARVNVENHLGATIRKLDAVITADDVTNTKPHPEPYLAALQKLAIKPSEAVVVENATLGVRSARAAGIKVIAVTSTLPASALSEADWVVPKVADAWSVVEGLMK